MQKTNDFYKVVAKIEDVAALLPEAKSINIHFNHFEIDEIKALAKDLDIKIHSPASFLPAYWFVYSSDKGRVNVHAQSKELNVITTYSENENAV